MRILFHVPYPLNRPASGSTVHPYRMRDAFIEAGFDVISICGNVSERRKQIIQLSRRQMDKLAFCYSSPTSYPVHPVWDYLLYIKIKLARIPLGVFYGDAYWLLAPEWIRQSLPRRYLLNIRYRLDLLTYRRLAKVVFFPSGSLAKFLTFPQKAILYPGAMKLENLMLDTDRTTAKPNTAIYVGSITPRYGLDILLEAFELANMDNPVILELVCPEDQFSENITILEKYRHATWLRVSHLIANQLESKYLQCKFGIIPLRRNLYNDLAMPVKLFEYYSHGLPVIVTDCTEMAQFVSNTNTGLVAEDSPEALANKILLLLENDDLYHSARYAVIKMINNGNYWKDRAITVSSALLNENLSDC